MDNEYSFSRFLVKTVIVCGLGGLVGWLAWQGNITAMVITFSVSHLIFFLAGNLLTQRSVERILMVNSKQDKEMMKSFQEGFRTIGTANRVLTQHVNQKYTPQQPTRSDDYVIDVAPSVAGYLNDEF